MTSTLPTSSRTRTRPSQRRPAVLIVGQTRIDQSQRLPIDLTMPQTPSGVFLLGHGVPRNPSFPRHVLRSFGWRCLVLLPIRTSDCPRLVR
jgi:hypothetical protein